MSPKSKGQKVPDVVSNRITNLEEEIYGLRRELEDVKTEVQSLRKRPITTQAEDEAQDKDRAALPVEKIRRVLGCGGKGSAREASGGGLSSWLGAFMCPAEAPSEKGSEADIDEFRHPGQRSGYNHTGAPPHTRGISLEESPGDDSMHHGSSAAHHGSASAAAYHPPTMTPISTTAPAVSPTDYSGITPPASPGQTPTQSTPRLAPLPPPSNQPPTPQVPPGWTAEWSRTRGRYYYVNEYTQQSVWEMPTMAAGEPPPPQQMSRSPPTIMLRSAAAGAPPGGIGGSAHGHHAPAPSSTTSSRDMPLPGGERPRVGGGGLELPFPEAEGFGGGGSPGAGAGLGAVKPGPAAGRIGSISAVPPRDSSPGPSLSPGGRPGGQGHVRRIEFSGIQR